MQTTKIVAAALPPFKGRGWGWGLYYYSSLLSFYEKFAAKVR
jgi:hypothetical protein